MKISGDRFIVRVQTTRIKIIAEFTLKSASVLWCTLEQKSRKAPEERFFIYANNITNVVVYLSQIFLKSCSLYVNLCGV